MISLRKNYFDSYLDILSEEQRAELLAKIKDSIEQTNDKLNIDETNLYQYLNNILNNKITHDDPYHEDVLDSYKFNKFVMDAYVNINMMYEELEALYKSIEANNKISTDIIDSLNKYINELEKRLAKFRYFSANKMNDFIFKESFDKTSYIETMTKENEYMFSDRNGEILEQATLVKDGGYVTLNEIHDTNIVHKVAPYVSVKRGNLSKYITISEPNNIVDLDKTKFFAEIAYTELSIDSIFVEITLDLKKKYRVNSIVISPISVFEQEIYKIYYKTTLSEEEQFKELKFSINKYNGDTYIIMPPTNISILKIVLKQNNYIERVIKHFADQNWEQIVEKIAIEEINSKLKNKSIDNSFIESLTGYEEYQRKYNEFINTYNEFVKKLNEAGYYWTESQIIDYIKSIN